MIAAQIIPGSWEAWAALVAICGVLIGLTGAALTGKFLTNERFSKFREEDFKQAKDHIRKQHSDYAVLNEEWKRSHEAKIAELDKQTALNSKMLETMNDIKITLAEMQKEGKQFQKEQMELQRQFDHRISTVESLKPRRA